MILVIENLRRWKRQGRPAPDVEGFRFLSYEDLTEETLRTIAPDMILSLLMADGFDALDVARLLVQFHYRGRYRALADAVPNPEAVREEVLLVAPGLDFDLFLVRSGFS